MWKEILRALFSLVRSPSLILIALGGIILQLAVLMVLAEPVLLAAGEILLAQEFLGPNASNIWVELLAIRGLLATMLVLLASSMLINTGVAMAFARFAAKQQERKSEGMASALFAFARWRRVIGWSALMMVLLLGYLAALSVLWLIGSIHWVLAVVLVLIWMLLGFVGYLVLIMGISLSGLQDVSVKEALRESVWFLKQRLGSFALFVVILSIVLGIWELGAHQAISVLTDENILLVLGILIWLVELVIANLAIPFYYLNHSIPRPPAK